MHSNDRFHARFKYELVDLLFNIYKGKYTKRELNYKTKRELAGWYKSLFKGR